MWVRVVEVDEPTTIATLVPHTVGMNKAIPPLSINELHSNACNCPSHVHTVVVQNHSGLFSLIRAHSSIRLQMCSLLKLSTTSRSTLLCLSHPSSFRLNTL